MQQPPLLPEIVLARVLRVSSFHGTSAFLLSTFFALLMAMARDVPMAALGVLAAGVGAIELHGATLLRRGDPSGMKWLITAPPLLLVVILAYCVLRVMHFTMPPIPDNLREMATFAAQQWGTSLENYFRIVNRITMQVLAVAALIYLSGMTRYYLRRRDAVERALTVEE